MIVLVAITTLTLTQMEGIPVAHWNPPSREGSSWSFFNKQDSAPSLDPKQEDVLEKLGLKPLPSEKAKKDENATEHLTNFASHVDIYKHTERPLHEQLAARKLGLRSYDPHILRDKSPDTQIRLRTLI